MSASLEPLTLEEFLTWDAELRWCPCAAGSRDGYSVGGIA